MTNCTAVESVKRIQISEVYIINLFLDILRPPEQCVFGHESPKDLIFDE